MSESSLPHVVIVGAGFGGLRAAKALHRAPVRITVVDKNNYHLFQPLLYQVATSTLTAEEIAMPIRSVLRGQKNVEVLLGEVKSGDLKRRSLSLQDGKRLEYDYLIVATGTETNFYGHSDWEPHLFGLKDLDDAFAIRRRVLMSFEAAERTDDLEEQKRLLTFAVVGGGPTGVEMAGALSELARGILTQDFAHLRPDMLRVVLVEMGARVLAPFDPRLSARAAKDLASLGVEVRTEAQVKKVSPWGIDLSDEFIPTAFICWAAGVSPRPLGGRLGTPCNARGAVIVQSDCSLPDHPEVFCIGDMAAFTPEGAAHPLPGLAPVALQQAGSVAKNIIRTLKGQPRVPFKYFDKGSMATIGRSRAVLQYGNFRMAGFLAWMAWIFVHVYYIIDFRNRALVLSEWFWAYLTQHRGARIITPEKPRSAVMRDDKTDRVTMAFSGGSESGR